MEKLITIMVLLLMVAVAAGCQPQTVPDQETQLPSQPAVSEPSQEETVSGPLTLEITSPTEGRETSWGFTRVRGKVSPASAVVSIDSEGYARVEADGSFESDYIVLDEGKNEIRVTATTGREEVWRIR